ncbi:MAG: ATP-dependent Clp protease ATP-binding subunit [Candidatus Aminicenantes bacterium]|nr:ATP-dependent Clp protease ATP-binding subunit [Candidatus Aminicenantes bacterium]
MPENLEQLEISPEFHRFLENLSEIAGQGDRIPFIRREKEIEAVMESLLRKLKNNLLLIGKPGVGKTALITEIASRINKGNVPRYLKQKVILELSMNTFLYSRESIDVLIKDFEKLFSEIKKYREKIILFLDEMQIQSVMGTNRGDEFMQMQILLKSLLATRELNIIAATTPENYFKYIKHDEILSLSFSLVFINEPDEKEMLVILKGVKSYFEKYYALHIEEKLFDKIYFLARNFIPHRAFPHKAIDLLDLSCSKSSLKGKEELRENDIYKSVSDISKLRMGIVKLDPYLHSRGIHEQLKKKVVNQTEALAEISRIIKLSRLETELNDTRPEGIFLFLGATGVGKSYLASKIAEYLFGDESKLRTIDLLDYKKPGDIRKLIGDTRLAPGVLVQEVENHPFSVILFEHIGHAHSMVLAFLGKVLSQGYIIDAFGKKHYLTNIIFVLNLTRIGEEKKGKKIGFVKSDTRSKSIVIPSKIMNVLDWVDEIIEFVPLTREHLKQIAAEKINRLKTVLMKKYHTRLFVGEPVLNTIAGMAVRDGHYGHSVGSIIERKIRIKLLDLITTGDKKMGIEIKTVAGKFKFELKT